MYGTPWGLDLLAPDPLTLPVAWLCGGFTSTRTEQVPSSLGTVRVALTSPGSHGAVPGTYLMPPKGQHWLLS